LVHAAVKGAARVAGLQKLLEELVRRLLPVHEHQYIFRVKPQQQRSITRDIEEIETRRGGDT
jgi:hypothetical protein